MTDAFTVHRRLNEIVPYHKLSDMDVNDVKESCHIAFEIIGYKPENFDEAFRKSWETSDDYYLSEFIFTVWRNSL